MPLDPQLQAIRDQRERDNVPPLYAMSLTEARAADLASIRASGGEPEHVHETILFTRRSAFAAAASFSSVASSPRAGAGVPVGPPWSARAYEEPRALL